MVTAALVGGLVAWLLVLMFGSMLVFDGVAKSEESQAGFGCLVVILAMLMATLTVVSLFRLY
jgi:hypothetical protein